jgi:hypothetical protein
VLDPALLNMNPWLKEEDKRLLELYHEHGKKWALIAKFFNHWTDNACYWRIKVLTNSPSLSSTPMKFKKSWWEMKEELKQTNLEWEMKKAGLGKEEEEEREVKLECIYEIKEEIEDEKEEVMTKKEKKWKSLLVKKQKN